MWKTLSSSTKQSVHLPATVNAPGPTATNVANPAGITHTANAPAALACRFCTCIMDVLTPITLPEFTLAVAAAVHGEDAGTILMVSLEERFEPRTCKHQVCEGQKNEEEHICKYEFHEVPANRDRKWCRNCKCQRRIRGDT